MTAEQQAWFEQYTPMAHGLAVKACQRMPREAWIWDDDIHQEALIGLMMAARTYRADAGVMFKTWAFQKIVGRIAGEGEAEADGQPAARAAIVRARFLGEMSLAQVSARFGMSEDRASAVVSETVRQMRALV